MQMTVGYKLIETETGAEVKTWGGTWGTTVDVPNPLRLPNGDTVHAPEIEADYAGHKLVPWVMDEPPPPPPPPVTTVSPRQFRLQLDAMGLLDTVEAWVTTQPRAIGVTFEYAVEFRRDDIMFNAAADAFGFTEAQKDQFFIAAAAL